MDQPGEKEDSTDQRKETAAEGNAEGSVGVREGCNEAQESAPGVLKKVGAAGSDEASPPLVAHPCSLLQFLLRACAGCLGLHGGYCSSSDDHKAPTAVPAPPEAVAAADSSQEGDGGGKANFGYVLEVVMRVWALMRKPAPPDHPREDNGGVNH